MTRRKRDEKVREADRRRQRLHRARSAVGDALSAAARLEGRWLNVRDASDPDSAFDEAAAADARLAARGLRAADRVLGAPPPAVGSSAVRAPAAGVVDDGGAARAWSPFDSALVGLLGRDRAQAIVDLEVAHGDRPGGAVRLAAPAEVDGADGWLRWSLAGRPDSPLRSLPLSSFRLQARDYLWEQLVRSGEILSLSSPARWEMAGHGPTIAVDGSAAAMLTGALARVAVGAFRESRSAFCWPRIARWLRVADYRPAEVVRPRPAPKVSPVGESASPPVVQLGRLTVAGGLTVQAENRGVRWSVSRQRFYDKASLGDLAATAADSGRAIGEAVEDDVFALLNANAGAGRRPDTGGGGAAWFTSATSTAADGAALTAAAISAELGTLRGQQADDRYFATGPVALLVSSEQDRAARAAVDSCDPMNRNIEVLSSPRVGAGRRYLIALEASPLVVCGLDAESMSMFRPELSRDPDPRAGNYLTFSWLTAANWGVGGSTAPAGLGVVFNPGA